MSAAARAARTLITAPIVVYQRVISPALPRRCRYEPTCSRYATQAIWEYGILRGLLLAAWRLLRCNPWSRGGFDPVDIPILYMTGDYDFTLTDEQQAMREMAPAIWLKPG